MLHTDHLHVRKTQASPIERIRRRRRSVRVTVVDWGIPEDSFEVARPEILKAELGFIYAHLSRGRRVELSGVEEESLPLGLARTRREVDLGGMSAALSFLAA